MADLQINFSGIAELENYIKAEGRGALQIAYRNCPDYEGMVLSIMIVFERQNVKYGLDLQWASFGLDFWGDTLMETYLYRFETLRDLLDYLQATYSIAVTDIPLKYKYNGAAYPNPLKEEWRKPDYEKAWARFRDDFKKGVFLDRSLALV